MATAKHDANVYRSARNIDRCSVSPAADLNALSVLSSRKMLVTKAALDDLVERSQENTSVDSGRSRATEGLTQRQLRD